MDEYADEELMELIRSHDHDAFSTLVRRHTDRFYALAYRNLFSRIEAEDIVQESFLKIWSKPSIWKADKNTKFVTWFYRVIINACYDHNKRKSSSNHDSLFVDELETEQISPEGERLNFEVAKALMELPDTQRAAITLCFYEGLSNREAAGILDIKLKALQSLLIRGKNALKMNLGISQAIQSEPVNHEY